MIGEVIAIANTGMKSTSGMQLWAVTILVPKVEAMNLTIGQGAIIDTLDTQGDA